MLRRILTALFLIPPVLYLIGWSPLWLFLVALVVTAVLGLHEFFALSRQTGFRAYPVWGYVAGGVLCLAPAADLRRPAVISLLVLVSVVLLTFLLGLGGRLDLKEYSSASAQTILGSVYVGFLLSSLIPLRFSEPAMGAKWFALSGESHQATGRNLMLLLFLALWAGDILAFVVGRSVGRTPFFPRISPKKTVEGAVAGLGGSLLVAWAFAHWFWQTADAKTVILLGGVVGLSGQVGDLVESSLKRGANVKDSGTLLPGHGGLLDRIDSLLFGAPALWLALTFRDLWPW
jgi:phosphatidate cytidylyltransferase